MIHLIRHLPTAWNIKGRLQGLRDEPILPLDQDLASIVDAMRVRLRVLGPFDRVLISELRRTRETAQALDLQDATVEPLLNELDFGSFEGKTHDHIQEAVGDAWIEDPISLTFGESLVEFQLRLQTFLRCYTDAGCVLVIGHGAWMRGLITLVRDGSIRRMNQFKIGNIELYQVDPTRMAPTFDPSLLTEPGVPKCP